MTTHGSRRVFDEAMACHRRGDVVAAEAGYRKVLAREPHNPDALHLLGTILPQRGDAAAGVELIERALSLKPGVPEAHFNLGNIQAGLKHFSEAEHHFRRAFELQPENAEAAGNLGAALLRLGRYDEAEAACRQALVLNPASATALTNLGARKELDGRFDEAVALYDRALAQHPKNIEARQKRALALLTLGRFPEGWLEYAWRFERMVSLFGRFAFSYWQGQALAGRKILVWTEQGIGDEILAGTMIPDLMHMGAQIVLICAPRVAPLFRRSFPSVHIVPTDERVLDGSILAGVEFQASFSDLGRWLRPSFERFSPIAAYLKADNELTQRLRLRYKGLAGHNRLVGISWRSRNRDHEKEKTVSLRQLEPILRTPGVTFVNLQYGDVGDGLVDVAKELGVRIVTDSEIDSLKSLDDFAAQVAAMDLVISVSNTTVHVAGALGQRVWALIPADFGRMWYWFLQRTDSPWYPQLRLFRQAHGGDWSAAISSAAAALRHELAAS